MQWRNSESKRFDWTVVVRFVTVVFFSLTIAAAFFRDARVVPGWDATFAFDVVSRSEKYGGSYYSNGLVNWGPLALAPYSVALIGGQYFWYVISAFVCGAALVIAAAAGRTVRALGGNINVAFAMAAAAFFHFMFSYTGIFDARNVTTAIFAAVWLLILWNRSWTQERNALRASSAAAFSLGLAVQTTFTSIFPAAALAFGFLATSRVHAPRDTQRRIDRRFALATIVGFLSAPVWYLLRGEWSQFRSGWVTAAKSVDTPFNAWPILLLAIVYFVILHSEVFRQQSLPIRQQIWLVTIGGWWIAGWMEVFASGQSSSFFSSVAVPTTMMAAALVALSIRSTSKLLIFLPLLVIVVAGSLPSGTFWKDLETLRESPVTTQAIEKNQSEPGDIVATRAVLDLVTRTGDPLLMGTDSPYPYLDYKRVSATKLTNPESSFVDDISKSQPIVSSTSPFTSYTNTNFRLAYPHPDRPVFFRNDVADQIFAANGTLNWQPIEPDNPRWKTSEGTANEQRARDPEKNKFLAIADHDCFVLTGKADNDLIFWFRNRQPDYSQSANSLTSLRIRGDSVGSSNAAREYSWNPSPPNRPFTLIVGKNAAALIIDGQIRGAVSLHDTYRVEIQNLQDDLTLTDLKIGTAPKVTGC